MRPLVNEQGLKNVESIVNSALKEGGELLTGGEHFGNEGYFYRPTIITNISPKMRIAQEEVFGPIAPIIIVDSNGYGMEVTCK
jgi:succinate-semialdehyde dehydrogenase/glutarate-semialdehyde dehydrogenase/succinyl-CoA reductase